jgi:hypothetical protein
VRRPGAGRKNLIDHDPERLVALDSLVEPESRGDPMCRLRWTCKSTRNLAEELAAQGHPASSWTVAQLLHYLEYSLRANAKQREGPQHPDRDAQFHYLNDQVAAHLRRQSPVISVDTKKKVRHEVARSERTRCVVRSKADTESGGIRTPVPDESGQSFRMIPDT